MSIISVFQPPTATQPHTSALLRDAIKAHETRMVQTSTDRGEMLPALIKAVLGYEGPVLLTFHERLHEPIAIVDGIQFRGDAMEPYSLEGGWLCVRTKHSGWEEVRSLEHLGEIARRTPLALVEAR